MAATELDRIQQQNDERWQAALTSFQELSGQYHALVRLIQSGLNTLSMENDALRAELIQLKREFHTMDTTFNQLLPHMAAIAAYVVRMQQREQAPQARKSPPRRVNGE